jgi:hypothetical protein
MQGEFAPCPFCNLSGEDRRLFELFLQHRGNLKQVERDLGLSYPTIRQRVDDLLSRLGYPKERGRSRMEILRRLRAGEIEVSEAADLLKRG